MRQRDFPTATMEYSNQTSSNASRDVFKYSANGVSSQTHLYIALSLMVVIIIVGCIGNIMAIFAVKTTKKLQSISNIFVINLSVCDLLFVTLVLPFNIYTYIADGWYLDNSLCKFVGILGYALTGTTIITITLIAWNRYKMVTNLADYKRIFVARNIGIMIAAAWLFPFVCMTPAITEVWGKFEYVPMLVTCNLILSHESQSFKLFLLIVRAVIPSFLIIYFYVTIFRTTKASHRRISRPSPANSILDHHNHQKEMHLTRMMGMIFVVFALSYFPCTITSVIDWKIILSKQFHMFCSITIYVGSAINPLVYGLMNSQFRQAYFEMMSCKQQRQHVKTLLQTSLPPNRKHLCQVTEILGDHSEKSLLSRLLQSDSTTAPSPENERRSITNPDPDQPYNDP